MLGRLGMGVDECISAYDELITGVFDRKLHRTRVSLSGRVQPQFDSGRLRATIKEVITKHGLSPDDPFNDGVDRGCRV